MICRVEPITIGQIYVDHKKWNLDPDYQRESGLWSKDKQQLFIDSLVNGFDVPKIYLHDIRDQQKPIDFHVVDGKQRISTIIDFIDGKFNLSDDFSLNKISRKEDDIKKNTYWKDWNLSSQEYFKSIPMSGVLILNAEEDDIEEIFQRLNNGEKLNAAEKRNAMGGEMCSMIRETAKHKFFEQKCSFNLKRYNHYEVSAKLLNIENSIIDGKDMFIDLKKRYLDDLVSSNKNISQKKHSKLKENINKGLNDLSRIFSNNDPSLKKVSIPQVYYLFVKSILKQYGHKKIYEKLTDFFPKFNKERLDNRNKPEGQREEMLIEFSEKAMQGTNDLTSMKYRVDIMTRYFLRWNQDIEIKDNKRYFNTEEKYVIWIESGKKCEICGASLKTLDEVSADHVQSHFSGGPTVLSNAQATCYSCNASKGKK